MNETTLIVLSKDRIDGTPGAFTVNLNEPITEPECIACTSVTLPTAINTVDVNNPGTWKLYEFNSVMAPLAMSEFELPPGRYNSMDDLIATMNVVLSETVYPGSAGGFWNAQIEFVVAQYQPYIYAYRVNAPPHPAYTHLIFPTSNNNQLGTILGFPNSSNTFSEQTYDGKIDAEMCIAPDPFDMSGGIHEVYLVLDSPDISDFPKKISTTDPLLNRMTIMKRIPVDYDKSMVIMDPKSDMDINWLTFNNLGSLSQMSLKLIAYSHSSEAWFVMDYSEITNITFEFKIRY